ncbi:putative protein-serine/threonine phosphatase [Helianthus debilis subsp. tardiflorus]
MTQVSDYCVGSLHQELEEAWGSEGSTNEWNKKWQSALSKAYDNVDKACVKDLPGGSTAVVVLVSPCQIIAANCGDSRAILCRGFYTIPLTADHKPYRQDENERIVRSGGHVIQDPWGLLRVDGVLAMTRAIGDGSMKPYVSAVPEVTFTTRTDEDECLIMASDGLWDVMSTELVGTMATSLLRHEREFPRTNEKPTQRVAKYLFKEAKARSSSDNFSVIVVDLKRQP